MRTLVSGLPPSGSAMDVYAFELQRTESPPVHPGPFGEINGNCRKSWTSSGPVCCYPSSNTFIINLPVVFLVRGEWYPAAVLRHPHAGDVTKKDRWWQYSVNRRFLLKMAGDIESNPGPKSKDAQPCDTCKISVSKSANFKCQDCDAVCHKKKECSGINRGLVRPWWCESHRDKSLPVNPARISCSVCEKTISCTSTPLKCPDCDALCHRYFTCSGIPTYNKNLIWKCQEHSAGENRRAQCARCSGKFGSKSAPLKCQQCDLHCHKHTKCSGVPKGTRYSIWNCGGHCSEEPVPDPTLEYPICVSCNIAVSGTNPLKCQDCDRVSHRVEKCSGLKRNNRKPNAGLDGFWNCGNHQYTPGTKCVKCKVNFEEECDTFKCNQCEERCHRGVHCSGIRSRQKNKTWNCGNHCTGTEPQIDPSLLECTTVLECTEETNTTQEECAAAQMTAHRTTDPEEELRCHHCKRTFRKGAQPFRCSTCNIASHRSEECSGVERWKTPASWNCGKHDRDDEEEDQAASIINPPELTAYKGPCAVASCKSTIKSTNSHIMCLEEGCTNRVHHKCSEMDKNQIKEYLRGERHWSCKHCLTKQLSSDHCTTFNGNLLESKNAREGPKVEQNKLRILQWNCDGIGNKMIELRKRAIDQNLDVILIQETKLDPTNKTPAIPGYAPFRTDRKNKKGGGLITFVKNSVIFEKKGEQSKDATDTQTIRIKMNKKKWIDITNLYCPPATSQAYDNMNLRLATEIIPSSKDSLIAGDFNAHCMIWDEIQPTDTRGEELLDWCIDKELNIINDGSPTRVSRGTGNESTPDVSLSGSSWNNKLSWKVDEPIGSSDHNPIIMEVNAKIKHVSALDRSAKWKSKGVDWQAFTEEVENNITDLEAARLQPLKVRISNFNKAILDAAKLKVGKTKPSRNSKPWMNRTVREKIAERNKLRKKVRTHRQEWLTACREVKEEIAKAKEESWREFLEESLPTSNEAEVWNVVRSLNGCPKTNSPNEAMVHNGRRITSPVAKADVFVEHYASVSNHNFSKEDRNINRLFRKRLDKAGNRGNHESPPYTMAELKRAVKKMRMKGAPGPDNIPPSFLKNLGERALIELLEIFNLSLNTGDLPQIWRNAIIIPLLKQGKPASSLASFRPISLTSCVVKLTERMLAERLYHIAESKGWFSKLQAGFRKGRGCEDQVLRITQAIEDAFNQTPRQSSVLVLLDFSKAYDTVWREKLLTSMLDKGVPPVYVQWLYRFLQNRQARVRYDGTLGKSKQILQGLPQGSVLAPLLFLFYINNLADILPDFNVNAMFADDVSILAPATTPGEAVSKAQEAVDVVVKWSGEWKLNLNAEKSEASFFTTAPQEMSFRPKIVINRKEINVESNPRLLGVYLDCKLSFNHHVKTVTEKATSKMRILAALSHTEWGWRKQDLKMIFIANVRSVMGYAGMAWLPWLSDSQINNLEVTQNKALRLITRQAKTTPIDCLRAETRVQSIKSMINTVCETAREKALRQPDDHPRRICLDQPPVNRLASRTSCRSKGIELSRSLPEESSNRRCFEMFTVPPWNQDLGMAVINSELHGISGKDDDPELILSTAIEAINSFDTEINIYTDGSVLRGNMIGGSGVVITRGPAEAPVVVESIKRKGAFFTCSYDEEVHALESAMGWLEQNNPGPVTIITDSQSLCLALLGSGFELDQMRYRMKSYDHRITVQWVPGHRNIPGNDLADTVAKEAAELEGHPYAPTWFHSVKAKIKADRKDPQPEHERTRQVYSSYSAQEELKIKTKRGQSLLAKIRSGHTVLFAAYRNKIDENEDPTCPLCHDAPQDLVHWMTSCAGTLQQRMALFGPEGYNKLDSLTKSPLQAIALAQATLEGAFQDC